MSDQITVKMNEFSNKMVGNCLVSDCFLIDTHVRKDKMSVGRDQSALDAVRISYATWLVHTYVCLL